MKKASYEFSAIIRELGLEGPLRLHRIRNSWADTVGAPVCLHTMPVRLDGSVLYLNVDSRAWLQELNLRKSDLLRQLRSFGVTDIKLKEGWSGGGKGRTKPTRRKSSPRELTSEDNEFIDSLCSRLDDEELRNTIRKAVTKSLSTKRH